MTTTVTTTMTTTVTTTQKTKRKTIPNRYALLAATVATVLVAIGGVTNRSPKAGATVTNAMLTLTFDDGWATQYTNVRPEMNSRGLKGTYLVISQAVQQSYACCLNPAQVKQLQADGNEIGSHSVDHSDLATLTPAAVDAQLKDSKTYLESLLGTPVRSFGAPYGSYTQAVIQQIHAVYPIHRTGNPGLADTETLVDQLPSYVLTPTTAFAAAKSAIDQAIAQKKWAILTMHDIVNSGAATDIQMNKPDFIAILNYIKSTGIEVVTLAQGAAKLTGNLTPLDAGLDIYADAVGNGFQDWGWAVHNRTNTAPVHSGANSISMEPDFWGGLLFHSTPFSSTNFDNFEFWINGGAVGGQKMVVSFVLNNVQQGQRIVSDVIGAIPANTWSLVSIPLASIGANNQINDIYISDASGVDQPTVYLDDIRLTPAGGQTTTTTAATTIVPTTTTDAVTTIPPTTIATSETTTTIANTSPTTIVAPTTTILPTTSTVAVTTTTTDTTTTTTILPTTSTVAVTTTTTDTTTIVPTTIPVTFVDTEIYSDSYINGFVDWGWAVRNLASNKPVHGGKSAIRWEPDNWNGLYIHSNNVNISEAGSLRFWINAAKNGGQKLRVVLREGNTERGSVAVDTILGRPLPGSNTWVEVVIPLAQLGGRTGPSHEIIIQDTSGINQNPVSIDDIRLTAQ